MKKQKNFIVTNNKKERIHTEKEFYTHAECWAYICTVYEDHYQDITEDLYVGQKDKK